MVEPKLGTRPPRKFSSTSNKVKEISITLRLTSNFVPGSNYLPDQIQTKMSQRAKTIGAFKYLMRSQKVAFSNHFTMQRSASQEIRKNFRQPLVSASEQKSFQELNREQQQSRLEYLFESRLRQAKEAGDFLLSSIIQSEADETVPGRQSLFHFFSDSLLQKLH